MFSEQIKFSENEKQILFNVNYDYSDDNASKYYKDLKDIEKFFAYMSCAKKNTIEKVTFEPFVSQKLSVKKLAKNCGVIIDPDSDSDLLQKVYATLWNEKYLSPCMNGKKIQGETLNSANTTLGKFYSLAEKAEVEDTEKNRARHKKNKEERERINKELVKKQGTSIMYILCRYFQNVDNIAFLKDTEYEKFVRLYHTLGNFMPVPWACNGPRGTGPLQDYWDLTLLNVYFYYTDDNCSKCECIKRILGNRKKQLIERYKMWLDSFGKGEYGWGNFINNNFQKAFVDENTLFPKEMWNEHFVKYKENGIVNPATAEQCKEYFENASECIEKRTTHMIEALQRSI